MELRKRPKKRSLSDENSTQSKPKQVKIKEEADMEKNGKTSMAFYATNANNVMTAHLGLVKLNVSDPLALPGVLVAYRADFKKIAMEKILEHFGVVEDGVEVKTNKIY